ncbi:MAG: flagellar biosynthetic protein FliR [Robiginitomaculum sp.]|nr:MAG: flagellar biosynthetic protein FliR [Robiginitomaculum sp.]
MTLSSTAFGAGLVFARIGSMLMLFPGIGESSVPIRMRLALALILSVMIASLLSDRLPPVPEQPLALAGLIGGEVLVGLMFGAIARLMMSALAVAGQMSGMQTGLAFAQTFDPSQGRQGAIFATFLNLTAVVLIFTTGLHHMFISGLVGSYELIPIGVIPSAGDPATLATDTVARSFRLGIQMAAPLIAFGLIFYLALGVLSRLMPQVQIFFVAMPGNVLVGLMIFAMSFSAMLGVWLRYMEEYGALLN